MKIELERKLFKPYDSMIWIYALDRNCIGISARFIPSWTRAWASHKTNYSIIGKKLVFELPQRWYDFYGFVQDNLKVTQTYSQAGDTVLLILEPKVK